MVHLELDRDTEKRGENYIRIIMKNNYRCSLVLNAFLDGKDRFLRCNVGDIHGKGFTSRKGR
jgi:hypothetical protein